MVQRSGYKQSKTSMKPYVFLGGELQKWKRYKKYNFNIKGPLYEICEYAFHTLGVTSKSKTTFWFVRLEKKKNTLSQSLREFFKPARHAVFIFYFIFFFTSIGLCLHAHAKPKMTEKFQLPYFQKSNGILHVFLAPTCLNSSKTANFLRFS